MTEASQHARRPASAYSEMVNILHGLSQNDPTLYQRVKQEIVTSLRTAKSVSRFDS